MQLMYTCMIILKKLIMKLVYRIITKDTTEENPIYLKYTMYEYTNLLDSSNMTIDVMMQIADTISVSKHSISSKLTKILA